METTVDWCRGKEVKQVFLGTVPSYYAAHRFYEKNAFERVEKSSLPKAFQVMEVDKYFYRLSLP